MGFALDLKNQRLGMEPNFILISLARWFCALLRRENTVLSKRFCRSWLRFPLAGADLNSAGVHCESLKWIALMGNLGGVWSECESRIFNR